MGTWTVLEAALRAALVGKGLERLRVVGALLGLGTGLGMRRADVLPQMGDELAGRGWVTQHGIAAERVGLGSQARMVLGWRCAMELGMLSVGDRRSLMEDLRENLEPRESLDGRLS